MKLILKIFSIAIVVLASARAASETADILFFYDDDAKEIFNGEPEIAVSQYVRDLNNYLYASRVDLRFNIVGVEYLNTKGMNKFHILSRFAENEHVLDLREEYGADFITLMSPTYVWELIAVGSDNGIEYLDPGYEWRNGNFYRKEPGHENRPLVRTDYVDLCTLNPRNNRTRVLGNCDGYEISRQVPYAGVASITTEDNAFAVVDPNYSTFVFAHEIGHNLGLVHHDAENTYARGYELEGLFGTIMYRYVADHVIGYYSNPKVNCRNNPCGVENKNDAARAIQEVKNKVIRHRIPDNRISGFEVYWDDDLTAMKLYDRPDDSKTRSMNIAEGRKIHFKWVDGKYRKIRVEYRVKQKRNGSVYSDTGWRHAYSPSGGDTGDNSGWALPLTSLASTPITYFPSYSVSSDRYDYIYGGHDNAIVYYRFRLENGLSDWQYLNPLWIFYRD